MLINGAIMTVAGGNLALDAAHAINARVDLITVDSAGALQKTAGAAVALGTTSGPKPADIPANHVLLAMVTVLGGAVTISNTEIIDKRITVLGGVASDALKGTIGTPSNANRFVTTIDPRMSDARRPTLHAHEHAAGGGDEIDVTGLHGRLADPQTPDRHGRSHQAGGSDAIKLDDLAAPDDNTDLNASTSKHGLMPKGNGNAEHTYKGDLSQGLVTTLRCDQSATNGRCVLPVGVDKWATG